MAIGRAERFEARKPRVIAVFGDDDETVLAVSHVFELMEMAWHDCYSIQRGPELTEKALLRWEYDNETGRDAHCRHHAQVPLVLPLGDGQLDLDKAHLPTGWVTMEEVIRFLIVDLEIEPPCGPEWPDVLERSEKAFYEEFTGKRHKPAAA